MEHPPNTVPITAEELDCIQRNPKAKFFVWCFVDAKRWVAEDTDNPYLYCRNDVKEYRIAAHDYNKYFGEKVNLSSVYNQSYDCWLRYLGHEFLIWRYSDSYKVEGKDGKVLFSAPIEKYCHKWLCDYFNELFKKDRPHDNIKFVWK